MDNGVFRVHEKKMSDGTSLFVPQIGFPQTDGNFVWARLALGDFDSMDKAMQVIEDTRSKVHHVRDEYHYVAA